MLKCPTHTVHLIAITAKVVHSAMFFIIIDILLLKRNLFPKDAFTLLNVCFVINRFFLCVARIVRCCSHQRSPLHQG